MDGSAPEFHNDAGTEDWLITCAETGEATGTGGRLWRVQDYIETETFLFTYGDAVGNPRARPCCETRAPSRPCRR